MKIDRETWKPIPEYENLYEISSKGRVKSCKRVIKYKNGINHSVKEHMMQPYLSKGYARVRLCKNNKHKRFFIHTLVAKAFIQNPCNYPIINHKDGNKLNNEIENLEWCTYSHNNREAYRLGLKTYTEKNREAFKLAKEAWCKAVWQLDENKNKIKMYVSCYEAERQVGLSRGCIYQAIRNDNKSGGFYWAFDTIKKEIEDMGVRLK